MLGWVELWLSWGFDNTQLLQLDQLYTKWECTGQLTMHYGKISWMWAQLKQQKCRKAEYVQRHVRFVKWVLPSHTLSSHCGQRLHCQKLHPPTHSISDRSGLPCPLFLLWFFLSSSMEHQWRNHQGPYTSHHNRMEGKRWHTPRDWQYSIQIGSSQNHSLYVLYPQVFCWRWGTQGLKKDMLSKP